MNTLTPQAWALMGVVAVLALLAGAAWIFSRRKESRHLQQRFGAEYDRAVDDQGSQSKAEAVLKAREARVAKFTLVPLTPADSSRFSLAWIALQSRFVDNPKGVVAQADQLVRDLMLARGYPVADFELRAADISVDHPTVVEHYRAAQATALRDQRGEADTEEQRKAVVHLRALFDELLAVSPTAASAPAPIHTQEVPR
jgi:hypothetical protein